MTRKFFVLLRLQMLGLFSINKLYHSKGKADKRRLVGFCIIGLLALAAGFGISYLSVAGSAQAGLANQLPAINLVMVSLFVVMLTFSKASGALFGLKDYDMVMSLPVSSFAVVFSRLTMIYLGNLVFSIIIFVPSIILYSLYGTPSIHGYIMYVLTVFLAPMLPMVVVILVGTLVSAIASRFRYKNLVGMILAFGAMAAYIYFMFSMSVGLQANPDEILTSTELGQTISAMLGQFYPPAAWLAAGIEDGNWAAFALFALVSVAAFYFYASITAKFYSKINTRVFSYGKNNNFKLGGLKTSSPFMALYRRELRRLGTNVTYALNTLVGPLLTAAGAIAVAVVGLDGLVEVLADSFTSEQITNTASQIAPVVSLFFLGLMPSTAISLSLEGKNRWIMCSLPIPAILIFKSKIALSLTVMLPAAIITASALVFALRPNAIGAVMMFAVPISYVLFDTILGMCINVKFPRYDWPSEYQLLKGGTASVYISVFGGIILTIVLVVAAIAFFQYILIINLLIIIFSLAGAAALYRYLAKHRLFA